MTTHEPRWHGRLPDEEWHLQLTTREGWQRFAEDEPADLALRGDPEWKELTGTGRDAYDEARIDVHARLIVDDRDRQKAQHRHRDRGACGSGSRPLQCSRRTAYARFVCWHQR
ncbi:hypothetical protein ETD96_40295, partial [Actinomadura geliboluensis]